MYFIFLFESTHHVIKAEKVLTVNNVIHEVIPTPKEISSDCGASVRIDPEVSDPDFVSSLLSKANIRYKMVKK